MVKRQAIAAALGAVLILGLWWWFTRPTPERQIRNRFAALGQVISKTEQESNSRSVLKLQQLERLMADPVNIGTERYGLAGTHGNAELVSLASRVRGMMSRIDLQFHDLQINELSESEANVTCTARFVLQIGQQGQEETSELRVRLVQVDGAWRFRDFQEVEVMQK